MNFLTHKFSEAEMTECTGKLLLPNERIKTAVYGQYDLMGFSSIMSIKKTIGGYAAITDKNRFISCKYDLSSFSENVYSLDDLIKIKISSSLFKIKSIYMSFSGEKYPVGFQVSPKIIGADFPHHEQNFEIMLSVLEAKQNYINN